jgi:hypothetical protein
VRPLFDEHGTVLMPEGPEIVLTTGPLRGLGDHLLYSTLPKRFAELGYTVFVDRDNEARNDEIMKLVWVDNPYVVGESTQKPNAGHVRQGLFYELANRYPIGSIEAMERAHGLPPPYSLAPWIAYVPQPTPHAAAVRNAVVLDFSSVSSKINEPGITAALRAMSNRFRGHQFITLQMPRHVHLHNAGLSGSSLQVSSLYEYCDVLGACHAWVGGEAGGQSLAAAVRGEHDVYDLDARPEIVATLVPKTYNTRGYTYRGVDYRVTSFSADPGADYFDVVEQRLHEYEVACARGQETLLARA